MSDPTMIDEESSNECDMVWEEQNLLSMETPIDPNNPTTTVINLGLRTRIVEPEVAYKLPQVYCGISIKKAAEAIREQTGLGIHDLRKVWLRKGPDVSQGWRNLFFTCRASKASKVEQIQWITIGYVKRRIVRLSDAPTTFESASQKPGMNDKSREMNEVAPFCTFCGRKVKHTLGSLSCKRRAKRRQKRLENLASGSVNPQRKPKKSKNAAKSNSAIQ